jgi:hypothetical protein
MQRQRGEKSSAIAKGILAEEGDDFSLGAPFYRWTGSNPPSFEEASR